MGRDTIQLEDVVSTISQEYLLEFSSEYYIPKNLPPELPGPGDHIVDFPEGKVGKRIENGAKTRIIRLNLVKSNYYSSYDEVVKSPRAYQ
ncbi:hypothetical protein Tco_0943831 [Tanacetum coccineum]